MRKQQWLAVAVAIASIAGGMDAMAQAPAATAAPVTTQQPAPPAELTPYGSGWTLKGSGALRFFGFKAYDANLWASAAQGPFSFSKPFALEIRYATAVKAKDICNTSLIEMQRIAASSPEQITAWAALMESIFVDVKAGDQLVGVHLPTVGVRFFHNGKLIGESADLAFSDAFFRIWLDPKSKRQDLRSALLGLAPETRRP